MGILAKFPIDPLMGLPKTGTSFADMTWEEVSKVCKAGKASEYFTVGDQRTITYDGTDYVIDIIGIEHDDVTDNNSYGQSKAGITCQFNTCLNTGYPMNSTNTNVGGWTDSLMRTSTMSLVKNGLPAALQDVLVAVNKLTSAGNMSTTINTTSDILFILSSSELSASVSTEYVAAGEGTQYKWYADGNSSKKTMNGTASNVWERSPALMTSTGFIVITARASTPMPTTRSWDASSTYGIAPCFCI